MIKLVLVRHGQSIWNKKELFTGWADSGLTKKGVEEAKEAGKILKHNKYAFDVVFTNLHKRTLKTLYIILKELNLKVPVYKSWRLNERHYGALQGLNHAFMEKKFGKKQVRLWRRSYSIKPPLLKKSDKRYIRMLRTYKGVPKKDFPLGESLKDTVKRFLPCWREEIKPAIKKGKKVLIVASHNSLRALVKHLDKIPDKDIPHFTLPTGAPLVYELDKDLKPVRHYYLREAHKTKHAHL